MRSYCVDTAGWLVLAVFVMVLVLIVLLSLFLGTLIIGKVVAIVHVGDGVVVLALVVLLIIVVLLIHH